MNTNLDISKRRITALGFFKCGDDKEPVTVSTKRGSSDEFVEVTVEVCETSTGTFQIGAGFSLVRKLHHAGSSFTKRSVWARPGPRAATVSSAAAIFAALC